MGILRSRHEVYLHSTEVVLAEVCHTQSEIDSRRGRGSYAKLYPAKDVLSDKLSDWPETLPFDPIHV